MRIQSALKYSAIDMTLALGADSFVRERNNPGLDVDPSGEHCFVNIIDLAVNSDVCFLPVPSHEEYVYVPELLDRLGSIQPIADCATVHLKASKEKRIFKAFWEVYKDFGYEWFAQWWKSHFSNQWVVKHHLPRLGNTAGKLTTITDQGLAFWREFIEPSLLDRLEPLGPLPKDGPHILRDANIVSAASVAPYQYCYAYDVFRRGWQYAEAARQKNLDIKYCPHQLRRRALSDASDAWIEQARSTHWSWGRCIAQIVKSNSNPVTTGQIGDWVNGLIAAKTPRWVEIPLPSKAGSESEYRKLLAERLESLETVAHAAKIPRQKLRPLPFGIRFVGLSIEKALEELKLSTVHTLVDALPAGKMLDTLAFHIAETARDGVNFYQTGTFGYPGLLSPEMEKLSRRRRATLL